VAAMSRAKLYTEHWLGLENSCETIPVDDHDVERCRRDPDQFAADYIGITLDEFHRWQEYGFPRCAATTKSGTPCTQTIGWCCKHEQPGFNVAAEARWFLRFHRSQFCRRHGGGAP
jgi:hypothetical protein